MAKWTVWAYIGFGLIIMGFVLLTTTDYIIGSGDDVLLEVPYSFILALGIFIVIHKLVYSDNPEKGKYVFSWKSIRLGVLGIVIVFLGILVGFIQQILYAGILVTAGVIMGIIWFVQMFTKYHASWTPRRSMLILPIFITFGGAVPLIVLYDSIFGLVCGFLALIMDIYYFF